MPPSFSVLPRRAVTISPPTSPYLPFHLDSSSVRSVFSPLFHPAALLNTPFVRCSSPVREGSSFDPPIKEFSIGCVSARKPPPSLPPTRNFTLSFFHLLSLSLSLSLSSFLLRVLDSTAKSIRRGGRERNDKPRDGKRWEEKARERERERERRKARARVGEKRKGRVSNGEEWPWQLGGRFTGSLRGSSRDNVVGGPLDRHLDAKLNDRRYLEPGQNKLLRWRPVDNVSVRLEDWLTLCLATHCLARVNHLHLRRLLSVACYLLTRCFTDCRVLSSSVLFYWLEAQLEIYKFMILWFRDVIRERTITGNRTLYVKINML